MESSSAALTRLKNLGVLVSEAIGPAAKKLRLFLNDDYLTYASTLLGLDVVEEQLRVLPLDLRDVPRGRAPVDASVVVAGDEWMTRLDLATDALEDLVQDMEAVAAASPPRWWRRTAPGDAVAVWLGSGDKNMTRMEIVVGRLASIYLQGGEIFDAPSGAGEAASEGKVDVDHAWCHGSLFGDLRTRHRSLRSPSPCVPDIGRHCIPGLFF